MPNYRISECAELLSVSDDTVRRWVETGKLPASVDQAGKQSIEGKVLAEFVQTQARAAADERGTQVSARNRFLGIVTKIQIEGLVAQVEIQSGSTHVVSLITADAARALNLEVGTKAVATVKATNVGVELA